MTIYNRFRRHSTWALRRILAREVTTQIGYQERRAAREVISARKVGAGAAMPRDREGAALGRHAERRNKALAAWRKARR